MAASGREAVKFDRVHIRWCIRKDMPAILDIENACFEFPWSEEDFLRCLKGRNCIGMVAEHDEQVVGFMLYELHATFIWALNFAVHPARQHRGVGSAMFAKMVDKLSSQRRNHIRCDVRESNLDAQLFFKAQGCRAVKVLPEFYEDTDESAYRFVYRYQSDEPFVPVNRIARLTEQEH